MTNNYKRLKLRLLPTKKQEKIMWKHVHGYRKASNLAIDMYRKELDENGFVAKSLIKKKFTLLLKEEEFSYLREISRATIDYAIYNVDLTYKKLFKKQIRKVHYKSRKTSNDSFYVRNDKGKFYRIDNKYKIEKIGRVKVAHNSLKNFINLIQFIEKIDKFTMPAIYHDGKFWYLSLLYKDNLVRDKQSNVQLSEEVIGIDLGIKTLATCSNGKSYKNINKTRHIKQIEKRLKRTQRKFCRKLEMNKSDNTYIISKNAEKLKQKQARLYKKLYNIRQNHIHNLTKEIVESYPNEVVVEDLKISNMIKNKHLSKAILDSKWYEIRRQLEYKCRDRGIIFTVAHYRYPSSQVCCQCGFSKKLKLTQRIYNCECGSNIDRDLNAAINLQNYRYSEWYHKQIAI